jgi:elongation factor G
LTSQCEEIYYGVYAVNLCLIGAERVKEYKTEQIRNLALCGHNSCGKTTFAEAILHVTGTSSRFGKVDEGTTVSDFADEEIARRISISATLLHADHKGTKFNLIDLPGFPDLIGETVAALQAVDIGVIVVSATAGVEVVTDQSFRYCEKYGLPRTFVITKLDKEHVEYRPVLEKLQHIYGLKAAPVQIPIGEALTFKGVVDLLKMKAYTFDANGKATEEEVPADMKDEAQAAREKLVESIAEADDKLLEKFFESGELTPDEMTHGLRTGIQKHSLYPVFFCAPITASGVSTFLDFAAAYFPTPADRGEIVGVMPGTTEKKIRKIDPAGVPTAYVFKTVSEPHVGELSLIRAFSGKISHGDELYNTASESSEKIGQIYVMNGKERKEIPTVVAGDMGALVKLRQTHTGDVLTSKGDLFALPKIEYPSPVVDVGIRPLSKGDEEKISSGLSRLREEDPTFKVMADAELNQTLIFAQGELQVDILVKKLKEKFGVDVELEKPRIPYRETITGKAEVQHKYKKQSGGRGQYGDVYIRMSPRKRGEGFEFVNAIVGGVIPGKFIPSVEKGVVEAMKNGQLTGSPVVDFQVELFFGSSHSVDSSDMAFKMAGLFAFRDAFEKCSPVVLEPVYNIEVRVPEEFTGDVMGDISSRRGRISGMNPESGYTVVKAQVPQAELYKYSTQIKSLTQGRGFYARDFSHYEEVPREIQERLIEEYKKARESEK